MKGWEIMDELANMNCPHSLPMQTPWVYPCKLCIEEMRVERDRYRGALEHATICPLTQKARAIMGDHPEEMTACDGCRDALLLLRGHVGSAGTSCTIRNHVGIEKLIQKLGKAERLLPDPELGQDVAFLAHVIEHGIQTIENLRKKPETA